ncbi:T9SS-dependent choice-of-anchor J family protein [Flavobacterium silvaticum]|uniref:T9SS type A sorting domain-containing protein n=1 Tax=Flavobacterium silvaticum TaxID=1852020 RepID=A0A972FRM5_9FLAO|nr:choice-of-anchor J domain-containing protein [Flavobacterium silvaticum]NMH27233.1 T9SS type A sorting domain-containing protein [Flavobacterium silvaticum]
MNKKLLFFLLFPIAGVFAQNLFHENFDSTQNQLFTAGWERSNQSEPLGTSNWSKGTAGVQDYFGTGAYNGNAATSFAYCNFASALGSGTISNWLFTPVISLNNGDVITFYSAKGLSGGETIYADRLELRISANGAASVLPAGAEDTGDFTTLALTINPDLTTDGYPTEWTQFSYTVSGIPDGTDCRIAFRYYVTEGGTTGANSDYVGIDEFSVDRPLSTQDFFKNNVSMYPNPATNEVRFTSKNGVALISAQVFDIEGRMVADAKFNGLSETFVNLSELSAGVYSVKVFSADGNGTAKLIKK